MECCLGKCWGYRKKCSVYKYLECVKTTWYNSDKKIYIFAKNAMKIKKSYIKVKKTWFKRHIFKIGRLNDDNKKNQNLIQLHSGGEKQ